MAKKVVGYVKLELPAGQAVPGQKLGPALGQYGLNMAEFIKSFNAATADMTAGDPIPLVLTAYADRSFTFVLKTPPASFLLRKAAGIAKGSSTPHTVKVGKVTREQLEEIAKVKQAGLTARDLDAAVRTIAGTARSIGIEVEGV